MKKLLLFLVFVLFFLIPTGNIFAKKLAALTFDDGPWPKYTREILDVLDKYEIHATFFVIGQHIVRHPEILKEVASRGHEIGNHTWDHPDISRISIKKVKEEILRTEELIDSICPGLQIRFLRPPYFSISQSSALAISRLGYWLVFTTIDSADWDKRVSVEQIIKRVLSRADRDVEIITFHDGGGNRARTVEALPAIIEGLKNRGYEFVTIEEIFGK